MTVKRYDPAWSDAEGPGRLEPEPFGDWVSWEDYEPLRKENAGRRSAQLEDLGLITDLRHQVELAEWAFKEDVSPVASYSRPVTWSWERNSDQLGSMDQHKTPWEALQAARRALES